MDKEYLKKISVRAVSILLTCLFVYYLVYHIFGGFETQIETSIVPLTTASKTLSLEGYIFRDETPVTSSYNGSRHYFVSDGEKVAKGGQLATVYSTNTNDSLISKITEIEQKISLLEESEKIIALSSDLSRTNSDIMNLLLSMRRHISFGNYGYAASSQGELLLALSKKQLQLYTGTDFKNIISSLYLELSSLKARLTGASQIVSATEESYFYYGCDGCEDIFDISKIETLTLSEFYSMVEQAKTPSASSSNIIGKTVDAVTWYVAAAVPKNALESFSLGKSYPLVFPQSSDTTLNSKLSRIVTEASSNEALLIFSLTNLPPHFDFSRCQNVRVVTSTVTGLAVPLSAMHYENGRSCVYILRGARVLLRTVDILDRFDGYYYVSVSGSSYSTGDGSNSVTYYPLAENDFVITYGTRLYHNRIMK